MVDAGRESPLRALSRLGVDSIDLLVATHPHADHIGGMDDVLTARPVGRYLTSDGAPETAVHQRLEATLERLSGVDRTVASDTAFTVGDLAVEVLAPGDPAIGSVGLVARFGDFTALLPGDAGRDELTRWLEEGRVPDATLLKASRHGGRDGFTHAFVAAAAPEVVVVSVGADNRRGHPRPEALAAYRRHAADILRTDLDGHVTVRGFADGDYRLLTGVTLDDRVVRPREATIEPDSVGLVSIDVVVGAPGSRPGDLNADYATLTNRSDTTLDLSGWRLCDLSTRCFRFPPGASVAPGDDVVVYTGYGATDGVSFFMNNDRRVWNENGDEATLYDTADRVVERHVY